MKAAKKTGKRAGSGPPSKTFFPGADPLPIRNMVDALLAELEFARGIEMAVSGVLLDDPNNGDVRGVRELVIAHIERLGAIGRFAEKVHS